MLDDYDTSWRELILAAKAESGDCTDIIYCTLTEDRLDEKFDCGFGSDPVVCFTAWSETRVYFPVSHHGSKWVGSVPRNPCDEITDYQGAE